MTAEVGVGLIGLGTVGTAVARRLVTEWEMLGRRAGATPVLRRVAVRDPRRPREVTVARVTLDADPEGLVDDPAVTIVVEVMGGVDRATSLMERALRAGKPVVTANKAAMAAHGLELAALAAGNGVSLRYEAAAGAGLPLVALLRDGLRGDLVSSMTMIINGTTNVVLTRMAADGVSFADALAEAQSLGFAEADPSADIDGHDAAAKLLLLSRLAFDSGLPPDCVDTTGIGAVDAEDVACARGFGGGIRLVAHAQRVGDGVTLTVRPTVVLRGHPLDGVDGVENAIVVLSDLQGSVVMRGPGAGGDSTASAVVSDIVATVRAPGPAPNLAGESLVVCDDAPVERGGYIRARLRGGAEDADLVIAALEDRGIPVTASLVAPGGDLAVLTGAVPREMLARGAETLDSLSAVAAVATMMDCVGGG